MAKLNISDFDDFKFETELASESFCTPNDSIEIISLRCCVKPITNDVSYVVYMQPQPVVVKRFVFLKDAIIYYNNKLEEIEVEEV